MHEMIFLIFFNDFTAMTPETRYKTINETREKGQNILAPKQMLQRLPIEIAQIQADKILDNY